MIVLLALAFTLALVPAVSAQPMKPLRCGLVLKLVWVPTPHWEGNITGDIEGNITVTPSESSFNRPQTLEHFFETWVIKTDDGETIEGFDEGVWSLKNFKWRSNGRVTAASGRWMYLVGCKVHTSGTTSELSAVPVTGVGIMTIVPGSHG